MEKPNLIVTFDMQNTRESREEVLRALSKVGEEKPQFLKSEARGIFLIVASQDPREITRKLTQLCREEPENFWYTYNYVPIDIWTSSELEEMEENVKKIAENIKKEETWRMTVNKRFYHKYHTQEIIEALAKHVSRGKVDLKNPQKILEIEIIGKQAGISLLEPRDIFSVSKVRYK
jgi:tRNA acetyltransferase TAN1